MVTLAGVWKDCRCWRGCWVESVVSAGSVFDLVVSTGAVHLDKERWLQDAGGVRKYKPVIVQRMSSYHIWVWYSLACFVVDCSIR